MNAIEKAVKHAAGFSDSASAVDQNEPAKEAKLQAQVNTVDLESSEIPDGAANTNQDQDQDIDPYLSNNSERDVDDNSKCKSIVSVENKLANHIDLPLMELESAGCISFDNPRSQTAEEYRHIKRPILSYSKNNESECSNIVMVTSSIENEGKTFTAINLALSIAMERDRTVLLIDADPAKGSLGSMLGISPYTPGLIDLLMGNKERFSEILYQTNVPNLRVVPVGENNQNATELLASESMNSLVLELSERYSDRVIILDAPPIIPTTESKIIAGLVGQIVFVVEAERTGQSTVTEALSYINPEKSIGLVLNKSKHKNMPGYGYTYNYGNTNTSNTVAQRS